MKIEDKVSELTSYMFYTDKEAIERRGLATIKREQEEANDVIMNLLKPLDSKTITVVLKSLETKIKSSTKTFDVNNGINRQQIEEFTNTVIDGVTKANASFEGNTTLGKEIEKLNSDEKEINQELVNQIKQDIFDCIDDMDEKDRETVVNAFAKAESAAESIRKMDPQGELTEENVIKYFNNELEDVEDFYFNYGQSRIARNKDCSKEERKDAARRTRDYAIIKRKLYDLIVKKEAGEISQEEYDEEYKRLSELKEEMRLKYQPERSNKGIKNGKERAAELSSNNDSDRRKFNEILSKGQPVIRNGEEIQSEQFAIVSDDKKIELTEASFEELLRNGASKEDIIETIDVFTGILSELDVGTIEDLKAKVNEIVESGDYSPNINIILGKIVESESLGEKISDESREDLAMQLCDISERIEQIEIEQEQGRDNKISEDVSAEISAIPVALERVNSSPEDIATAFEAYRGIIDSLSPEEIEKNPDAMIKILQEKAGDMALDGNAEAILGVLSQLSFNGQIAEILRDSKESFLAAIETVATEPTMTKESDELGIQTLIPDDKMQEGFNALAVYLKFVGEKNIDYDKVGTEEELEDFTGVNDSEDTDAAAQGSTSSGTFKKNDMKELSKTGRMRIVIEMQKDIQSLSEKESDREEISEKKESADEISV